MVSSIATFPDMSGNLLLLLARRCALCSIKQDGNFSFLLSNGKCQLQSFGNSELKYNASRQHFDKWPLQRWSINQRKLYKCWERFESRRERKRQILQEARGAQGSFCSGEIITWKGKSSSPGLCGVRFFREWTIKASLNVYEGFLGFDQLLAGIIGSFFMLSHVWTYY